jgi:hypothetical protein
MLLSKSVLFIEAAQHIRFRCRNYVVCLADEQTVRHTVLDSKTESNTHRIIEFMCYKTSPLLQTPTDHREVWKTEHRKLCHWTHSASLDGVFGTSAHTHIERGTRLAKSSLSAMLMVEVGLRMMRRWKGSLSVRLSSSYPIYCPYGIRPSHSRTSVASVFSKLHRLFWHHL